MEEQLYIFEVIKNKHRKGQNESSSDTIVAPTLESVLKFLEKDRADPSVDIISINKILVVTALL